MDHARQTAAGPLQARRAHAGTLLPALLVLAACAGTTPPTAPMPATKDASALAAGADSDGARLAARTREADAASQAATVATRDAASSQRASEAAQRQTDEAMRQAAASQRQASAVQQQAAAAKAQAGDADRRSAALQTRLRELNAKQTDRGMVVTIGDVLFDTGQSRIKSGGVRNIERLGGFLRQYPQRKALIEGYTDSVGGELANQELSGRRADAVLAALLGMGVQRGQLAAQGYGELHPVAGNDSAGGRQANRRVEIVLSDESGALVTR